MKMMRNITKLLWCSLFVMGSFTTYAQDKSIGGVAENLLGPAELLTKLTLLACYIVGAALVMVAIAQYKIHRQSPKLVPLSTPITLLILGIIALLIPYGSNMFGESGSAVGKNKNADPQENVLPLPDLNRKGPSLPLPSSRQSEPTPTLPGDSNGYNNPNDTTGNPPSEAPPEENTNRGGHWSSDPRYNP